MKDIPTAFPWTHDDLTCTGMTLRDYFAAKAMQSLLTHEQALATERNLAAKGAYAYADAMLKAREA